jgi:hypothetical protein
MNDWFEDVLEIKIKLSYTDSYHSKITKTIKYRRYNRDEALAQLFLELGRDKRFSKVIKINLMRSGPIENPEK